MPEEDGKDEKTTWMQITAKSQFYPSRCQIAHSKSANNNKMSTVEKLVDTEYQELVRNVRDGVPVVSSANSGPHSLSSNTIRGREWAGWLTYSPLE